MGLAVTAMIADLICWALTFWTAGTDPAATSVLALVFGFCAILYSPAVPFGVVVLLCWFYDQVR